MFIDESIHSVKWDEDGNNSTVGSYSYIICRGNLSREDDIDKATVLAQDVDYIKEGKHIEFITESAIGKVLFMLIHDFKFAGHVQIYTDNETAAIKWNELPTNSSLSQSFESVKANHIPRENNKRADKLARTKLFISTSPEVYEEIVNKVTAYDKIQSVVAKSREMECKKAV